MRYVSKRSAAENAQLQDFNGNAPINVKPCYLGICTSLYFPLGPYLVIISFSSSLSNYCDAGGRVLPLFIMKKTVEK